MVGIPAGPPLIMCVGLMRCAMTTVNVGEGPRQPSTDEVEGVTAAGTTKGARKGRGGRVVNAWRLGDVGA